MSASASARARASAMDTTITSVINIKKSELKKLNIEGVTNALEWSAQERSLYIGRAMRYVPGATKTSRWANPFSVEQYGRDKCLKMFEAHVRANKDGLWDALEEIDGKELGCWCCPEPCHGNVLIKLLAEKRNLLNA